MSIAAILQELAIAQDDLDVIKAALDLDPADADAMDMKPALEEQLADVQRRLAAAQKAEQNAPPPPALSDDAPKYDMSKHPKFRKVDSDLPPPPPEELKMLIFNTGDSVMAKYSADKQWYAATVLGKTGSSADPVYTVKFTGYAETETKRKHEVRAAENRKRKADAPPATASAPPPPPPVSPKAVQNGAVISAAPSVDPSLVQKREPSKVSDGPTRMAPAPKKLKGNKTLEKAKSSWNDWQKSGPKKPALGAAGKLGKDSQFRTPEGGKVGFVGSGKPMSKEQVRKKWNYAAGDDAED